MSSSHSSEQAGFTLVELLIVVTMVSILAALAFPSYQDSVRKGRRATGKAALNKVQLLEERYRTNNASYGTLAQIGNPTDPEGNYTLAVTNTSATGYTTTATAQGDQAKDKAEGVSCKQLSIVVAAGVTTKAPSECW